MHILRELVLLGLIHLGTNIGAAWTRPQATNKPHTMLCNSLSKKAIRTRAKLCREHGVKLSDKVNGSKNPINDVTQRDDKILPLPLKSGADTIEYRKFVMSPPVKREKRSTNSSKKTHNKVNGTCVENNTLSECINRVVDSKNGYEWTRYPTGLELNVTFFEENGCWKANIFWEPPVETNSTKCIGYEIRWFQDTGFFFVEDSCHSLMSKNITSFVIDPSRGWLSKTYHDTLDVVVFPLPSSSEGFELKYRRFTRNQPLESTITPTTRKTFTSTPKKTSKTRPTAENSEGIKATETKDNNVIDTAEQKINRSKSSSDDEGLILKLTLVSVLATVAVVAILLAACCKKKMFGMAFGLGVDNPIPGREVPTKDSHYISYYSENAKIIKSAIKIASWLESKNIDVILDKFDVITSRKRVWCESHLSRAKRVIMIVSPGYLNICKFGEEYETEKKHDCLEQQLAWNEICQIRHKMMEKPLTTDRFVVVLVETTRDELPFWMSGLPIFKYKNGILNESVLDVLRS